MLRLYYNNLKTKIDVRNLFFLKILKYEHWGIKIKNFFYIIIKILFLIYKILKYIKKNFI